MQNNCCPDYVRTCTDNELRYGRFSNPDTRCDPCAMDAFGNPQLCRMSGMHCPIPNAENSCRTMDGSCITLCSGSPGPRPIPPHPHPGKCRICEERDRMVVDSDPTTCMRFDPNHNINNCCCEAGQICRNKQGQDACVPVWAKAQNSQSSSCPPGFSWSSYASQTSGLPCVRR